MYRNRGLWLAPTGKLTDKARVHTFDVQCSILSIQCVICMSNDRPVLILTRQLQETYKMLDAHLLFSSTTRSAAHLPAPLSYPLQTLHLGPAPLFFVLCLSPCSSKPLSLLSSLVLFRPVPWLFLRLPVRLLPVGFPDCPYSYPFVT